MMKGMWMRISIKIEETARGMLKAGGGEAFVRGAGSGGIWHERHIKPCLRVQWAEPATTRNEIVNKYVPLNYNFVIGATRAGSKHA